jgi:hypothetical protein
MYLKPKKAAMESAVQRGELVSKAQGETTDFPRACLYSCRPCRIGFREFSGDIGAEFDAELHCAVRTAIHDPGHRTAQPNGQRER